MALGPLTVGIKMPPKRGPLVKLGGSQFGRALFSGGDRALYVFTRDPRNKTRYYGACAEAWPPLRQGPASRLALVSIPTGSGRSSAVAAGAR